MPHDGSAVNMRRHWPEYLMEAALLGAFMFAACVYATALWYPGSPLNAAIDDPLLRRAVMGLAMGLTSMALVYSPWGQQSGGHMNPALTFTFFRLGKVAPRDALAYAGCQVAGGIAGALLAGAALGHRVMDPPVNYIVTRPGAYAVTGAFLGELTISFILMTTILVVTNRPNLARYTPLFGGALVATFITLEDPVSGMSMNPARTLAVALPSGMWDSIWVYFVAPPLGMLLAAEVFVRVKRPRQLACAKLHHDNPKRCIFCQFQRSRCGVTAAASTASNVVTA